MSKNSKRVHAGKQDKHFLKGVCKSESNKATAARRLSISCIRLPKMTPVPKIKQQQQQYYIGQSMTNMTKEYEQGNRSTQLVTKKIEDYKLFMAYILSEMEKMNMNQVEKFKQYVLKSLIDAMNYKEDDANIPADPVSSTFCLVPCSDPQTNVNPNPTNTYAASISHAAQQSFVINNGYGIPFNQQNAIQYGMYSVCALPQSNTTYVARNPEIPVKCDMVTYNNSLLSATPQQMGPTLSRFTTICQNRTQGGNVNSAAVMQEQRDIKLDMMINAYRNKTFNIDSGKIIRH